MTTEESLQKCRERNRKIRRRLFLWQEQAAKIGNIIGCSSENIVEHTQTLVERSRWIPVEERLPDNSRTVDVTCVTNFGRVYMIEAEYNRQFELVYLGECTEDADWSEEHDEFFAKAGWYENCTTNPDDMIFPVTDAVLAWKDRGEPFGGEK